MAQESKRKMNALTAVETARVVRYIEENYEKDELSDPDFAKKAEIALGFSISRNSITNFRQQLNIKSTRYKEKDLSHLTVLQRLDKIEKDIKFFYEQLEKFK